MTPRIRSCATSERLRRRDVQRQLGLTGLVDGDQLRRVLAGEGPSSRVVLLLPTDA